MRVLLIYLFASVAFAGTAVGNFNFKTQFDFDFRIGYPPDWNWRSTTTTLPGEAERWVLDNTGKASAPAKVSSAVFSFLAGFPATNDKELEAEIKRLHPTLKWNAINNPDFTVGFVSDQTYIGAHRTLAYEYYFSAKYKVIRIEITRDADAHGAEELDMILSGVRRPSGKPRLLSVTPMSTAPVKPGEEFCYALELDLLKTDFEKDSLTEFDVDGAFTHWSFKRVTWDRPSTSLIVCLPVDGHFAERGLNIKNIRLSAGNGSDLNCSNVSTKASSALYCDGRTISYTVPKVVNATPLNQAPVFQSVSTKGNTVRVEVQGTTPLAGAEVKIAFSTSLTTLDSQLVYQEELSANGFSIAYEMERLPPGFTSIQEINVIDQMGNAARLKALVGKPHYTYFSTNTEPQETRIPIVSLEGAKP